VIDFVPSRRGHFRLESGYHASVWLDLGTLFADPQRIAPKVDALASSLRKHKFDAVCGAMVGGAFLGQLLAHALGVAFWFTDRRVTNGAASYVLPEAFIDRARDRRVAIVDDVMSAGSAMRGTYNEMEKHGARTAVAAAFLILGSAGIDFFTKKQIPVEWLAHEPFDMWQPLDCRLCAAGVPLEETM
jgi:orotate phosphoribosyltransferase